MVHIESSTVVTDKDVQAAIEIMRELRAFSPDSLERVTLAMEQIASLSGGKQERAG